MSVRHSQRFPDRATLLSCIPHGHAQRYGNSLPSTNFPCKLPLISFLCLRVKRRVEMEMGRCEQQNCLLPGSESGDLDACGTFPCLLIALSCAAAHAHAHTAANAASHTASRMITFVSIRRLTSLLAAPLCRSRAEARA